MIPVETPAIGIDQLDEAVQADAVVVDVREPGEHVAGHVPGAVLIPVGQLSRRTAELYRGAPVYVVCASGNRSATMTRLPAQRGLRCLPGSRRDERVGPVRPSRCRRLCTARLRTHPSSS